MKSGDGYAHKECARDCGQEDGDMSGEWLELWDRVYRLEKDSHPPVAFAACSECHAVVFEEDFDNHRAWHVGLEEA